MRVWPPDDQCGYLMINDSAACGDSRCMCRACKPAGSPLPPPPPRACPSLQASVAASQLNRELRDAKGPICCRQNAFRQSLELWYAGNFMAHASHSWYLQMIAAWSNCPTGLHLTAAAAAFVQTVLKSGERLKVDYVRREMFASLLVLTDTLRGLIDT